MSTITTQGPSSELHDAPQAAGLVPSGLLGGIGGIVFVLLIVLQNAIRAGFPHPDASAATVAAYYADHHGATTVLAAVFPLGALGLVLFLAAVLTRVADGPTRAAGLAGGLGGVGIVAGYTMVMATDIALAEVVHRGHSSPAAIDALWVLHNATFATLLIWIGIAVAGLTAATSGAGVMADGWRPAGLLGGIALLVAAGGAFGVLEGSAILLVGFAGFLVWAVFVAATSVRLLRDRRR